MGLYNNGETTSNTYTIDVDATTINLSFSLYQYDAWGGSDQFVMSIGGTTVLTQNFPEPFTAGCSGPVCVSGGSSGSWGVGPADDRGFNVDVYNMPVPAGANGSLTIAFEFASVSPGGTVGIDDYTLRVDC